MFNKKGQVTIFVILGILVIVVLGILFLIYGEQLRIGAEEEVKFDVAELEPLKNFVEDCIDIHASEALTMVGRQGGMFNPGNFINYDFPESEEQRVDSLTFLCYTNEFEACTNEIPLLANHIETELKGYLTPLIRGCVDLDRIRKEGFVVDEGNLVLTPTIGRFNTIINVDYPLTITKGETVIREERFSQTFNIPLGKLIEVSHDIIDDEITQGEFFPIPYMLNNRGEITVNKHRPGNAKVYRITHRDYLNYEFQFAVQNFVY